MYNVPRVSPSALSATEVCPRFRSSGESNAAAVDGTIVHEMLEQLMLQPRDTWAEWIRTKDVGAEYREMMESAVDEVSDIVLQGMPAFADRRLKFRAGKARKSLLPVGIYPELEIETGKGRHGYLDVLVVTEDGIAHIIDWKTVRNEHDYELQLAAYAVYLHKLVPAFKAFDCRIVAPRLQGEPERHFWTVDDLAALQERIEGIEKRADDAIWDPAIASCPGEYCQYCHANGKCPAQSRNALEAVPVDVEPPVKKPEMRVLMDPQTPEERGYRRSFIKPLEAAIKAWKKQDEEFFEEFGHDNPTIVPGFKATWANKPSFLDKSPEAQPRIRNVLMAQLGLSDLEVMDCSPVSKPALIELLTRIPEKGGKGMKEKDAKKAVEEALGPFMRKSDGKSLRVVAVGARTKEAPAAIDVF